MFLVVKSYFHPSIGYADLTVFYHELHINNTKTIHSKSFPKTLNFYSQTFYSHHNFVQKKGPFQGHKHLFIY